jgi:phytoene desaturase (3,4-didehydrolycopene-forming)
VLTSGSFLALILSSVNINGIAFSVFLAEHYESSFTSIFASQELPAEPSFYVNVPSRVDKSAAPEGKDAVVVLVPVGHLGGPLGDANSQGRMAEVVHIARKKILATLETRLRMKPGAFEKLIVHEIVNTPETCKFVLDALYFVRFYHESTTIGKEKFNLDKGAILGLSHSFL